MSTAVICGLIILIICAVAVFVIFRFTDISSANRLGVLMLAAFACVIAASFLRVGEFPGERKERAKACLNEGYTVDLYGHELFGGNINLDEFTVTVIDDEHRTVFVVNNENSPEWARSYNVE